jgi:hypothetical protein
MSDAVDDTPAPVRYVSMPGSPYTGSTLLGMLMANHPACTSIGAATGLTAKVDLDTYLCSCGVLFRECCFWRRIAQRTEDLGYPVTVFKTNFWNTHVRVSRRRWLNGLVVSSLGNPSLTAIRDATIARTLRCAGAYQPGSPRGAGSVRPRGDGQEVFVDTARIINVRATWRAHRAAAQGHPSGSRPARQRSQHHEAHRCRRRPRGSSMAPLQR